MKKTTLSLILVALTTLTFSQELKTPEQFLGYKPGTRFTYLDRAMDYCRYVAETSPNVDFQTYGTTYEGRTLGVCLISSPENLERVNEIKLANLIKTGMRSEKPEFEQIPIIWLSFNVHGNESVGLEASLKTLYTLASGSYAGTGGWLESSLIILDPCLNPDGRERYTQYYNMTRNLLPTANPDSREHNQPWPGARSNHYLFDLNRDWTWQTQTETQQRTALYNSFMPHVHADFHEMGADSPFFFPPGADPLHDVITPWQKEFAKLTGEENARLFDAEYRLYFSKETFDLLCPSYGDTWPTFNGAIGFTYEQGGGGFAGIEVELETGDTLTLEHRINGHFMGAMATVNTAIKNKTRLLNEFNKYFEKASKEPSFEYRSIIVKGSNRKSDLDAFKKLLTLNQIKYTSPVITGKKTEGFDYLADKKGEFVVEKGDILIPAAQPQANMVRVLFEPETKASDSLSYDLTAWSLPYVYNLKAYATKEEVRAGEPYAGPQFKENVPASSKPYAYLANFTGFDELKLLAALYSKKVNVRYSLKPFSFGEKKYERGTLIIARGDNSRMGEKFDAIVIQAANRCGVTLDKTSTGLVSEGKDLGTNYSVVNDAPVVAIVGGEGVSSGSFGEMWYFFEQELQYPVITLGTDYIGEVDLSKYDVIILPSGNYSKLKDTLMTYVKEGGRVIALESAVGLFAGDKNSALGKATEQKKGEEKSEEKKIKSDDPTLLKVYENQRRYSITERSANSIYRVKLDDTHPYAFGLGKEFFIVKRSTGYPYLASGSNIGYITENDPVAGFAGYKFREKIKNTLVIGSERLGKGEVVYIADNPYFRGYWAGGRTLLGNVILR